MPTEDQPMGGTSHVDLLSEVEMPHVKRYESSTASDSSEESSIDDSETGKVKATDSEPDDVFFVAKSEPGPGGVQGTSQEFGRTTEQDCEPDEVGTPQEPGWATKHSDA